MNAHDTALAIATAIAKSPASVFDGVHIYAHDTEVLSDGATINPVEEIHLPGIFVQVKFESLAGSHLIGRGKLEVDLESQSDDETAATHSARETALRAILADQAALVAAFEAVGSVQLCGRLHLIENEPDVEDRAFKTPLTYRIGVRAL